jgi:hypothetical protein
VILEVVNYANIQIFERKFFDDFEMLLKKYRGKITHNIVEVGNKVKMEVIEDDIEGSGSA